MFSKSLNLNLHIGYCMKDLTQSKSKTDKILNDAVKTIGAKGQGLLKAENKMLKRKK